jgi:excisionase family DNA binding protein
MSAAAATTHTQASEKPTTVREPICRLAYSIDEVGRATGLGRSTIYMAIAAGKLRAVKLGRRRLVRAEDLNAFVDSLGAEN